MRRLLLILAIFAAQFAVFELGMRAAGGSEAAPAFQRLFMPDARIGHRLRPGASTHFATSEFATDISINAPGVRGPEFRRRSRLASGASPSSATRSCFAVQVPAGTRPSCSVLEDRLNRGGRRPRSSRVINGGVQGYGPVEELLFYRAGDRAAASPTWSS